MFRRRPSCRSSSIAFAVGAVLALLASISAPGAIAASAEPETVSGLNGILAFERSGQIRVVAAEGGTEVTLARHNAMSPAWSPDGRQLAFSAVRGDGAGGARWVILTIDLGGPGETQVVVDGRYPAWSPDGTQIAFARGGSEQASIWVVGADGTGAQQLTDSGAYDRSPSWSPDGSRIAFTSDRDGDDELYVMAADGTAETRITESPGYDGEPSWAPDGTRLAFTTSRGADNDIYTVAPDGSTPQAVTGAGSVDGHPSWSPDGSHIAYIRGHEGHVAVMDADGSNSVTLTQGTEVDWQPVDLVDATDPTITVTTPSGNGLTYDQGEVVPADFGCADPAPGWGVLRCTAEVLKPRGSKVVADGDRLPTGQIGNHTLWVTAIDQALNEVLVVRSYRVVDHQPDLRIAVGSGAYVGNNVYNTTGRDQTRIVGARPGWHITFPLSVQNDGTASGDRIVLRGQGSTVNFEVRYYQSTPMGGLDVTRSFARGFTLQLDPGHSFGGIEMVITPKAGAPAGLVLSRLVTATSVGHPADTDAVGAVVVVAR